MTHRKMILTDAGAAIYRNRMLTAGSPVTLSAGDARLFAKHGWAEEAKRRSRAAAVPSAASPTTAKPLVQTDDVKSLRAAYETKFGKKPFNGWDAATLREKIAAA